MSGEITFKQWNFNAPIQVYVNITGLKPGKHALHIHAFGDISDGCKSTGPHFRHSIVGNVEANEEGKIDIKFNTLALNLFGLTGILGRSIVVHEKASGEFINFNRTRHSYNHILFHSRISKISRLVYARITICGSRNQLSN